MIARRLGIDSVALRKKNLLKLGEAYVPGESGMDSDLAEGLDLVCREIGYGRGERTKGRGIGIAIGFKDSGGVNKPAEAQVKATTTGGIIVNCGTTEIGQGIQTAFTRIVAELFACPPARVSYAPINTDVTPGNDGLVVSASFSIAPGHAFSELNPVADGVRVLLLADDGTTRLDATVPGGAYSTTGDWRARP